MKLTWATLGLLIASVVGLGDDKKPDFRLPNPKPTKVYQTFVKAGGSSWDAVLTQIPQAWAVTKGAGVRIAILDTGVDVDHPEIKGRVVGSKDFTGSPNGARDLQGHGTHCATVAAGALQVDGGAPEASILNGKVLNDKGSGDFDWLTAGILWAIEQKADVISMSIGSGPVNVPPSQFDPSLQAALKKAQDAGIVILAAAGNEGPGANTTGYPARFPECVSVAACNRDAVISNFSSRGADVFVTSPGEDILGGLPNGKYAEWDGTSMATPKVGGVAGLYVAHCRKIGKRPSNADFKELLKASSRTKNPNPPSTASGYGLLQAAALLAKNGSITPPDPPTGTNPFKLSITLGDLSQAKQVELRAAGVTSLNLSVEGQAQPKQVEFATVNKPDGKSTAEYKACYMRTKLGTPCTLYVGVRVLEVNANIFQCPSINGWADGVYDCTPPATSAGDPTFKLRGAAPVAVGNDLVPADQCPGGVCPPPSGGVPARMPSSQKVFPSFEPFGGAFRRR